MELNFKWSLLKVRQLEKEQGKSLPEIVSEMSIDTLIALAQTGLMNESGKGGVSEKVASEKIDEVLEQGDKDVYEIQVDIMDSLIKAGFLPKSMTTHTQAIRKGLQEGTLENQNI